MSAIKKKEIKKTKQASITRHQARGGNSDPKGGRTATSPADFFFFFFFCGQTPSYHTQSWDRQEGRARGLGGGRVGGGGGGEGFVDGSGCVVGGGLIGLKGGTYGGDGSGCDVGSRLGGHRQV